MDGTQCAVGEGCGVEAGSRLGVLIVPEANRVLCHCESFRFEAKSHRVPHLLSIYRTYIRFTPLPEANGDQMRFKHNWTPVLWACRDDADKSQSGTLIGAVSPDTHLVDRACRE